MQTPQYLPSAAQAVVLPRITVVFTCVKVQESLCVTCMYSHVLQMTLNQRRYAAKFWMCGPSSIVLQCNMSMSRGKAVAMCTS